MRNANVNAKSKRKERKEKNKMPAISLGQHQKGVDEANQRQNNKQA